MTRLQRSLDAAAALAAERLRTIDRLEDDLASASQAKSSGATGGAGGVGGGAGGSGGTPRGGGGHAAGLGGGEGSDALRELLGVSEGEAGGCGGAARAGAGVAEVDGHGVLGIVQVRPFLCVVCVGGGFCAVFSAC